MFASVAQRIEQRPSNPLVARSSRVGGTFTKPEIIRISGFLKVPSLLRVESTVCFQRKRGLRASLRRVQGVLVGFVFGFLFCVLPSPKLLEFLAF